MSTKNSNMKKPKNGGPAFPMGIPASGHVHAAYTQTGMTLRDWFAGQIANGLAAHSGTVGNPYGPGDIAARSYEVSDAMLAARKGNTP